MTEGNQRLTVLVADDEKVVRVGCRRILEAEGHSVAEAADGLEALALAEEQRFDVVLLDLRMPGMGGTQVLDRLGARYPELPVVVISGHASRETETDCLERGAVAFVSKPFRSDDIVAVVGRAVKTKLAVTG
ncbi:MAG: response regulator [Desulfatibacillaceae bacterium]